MDQDAPKGKKVSFKKQAGTDQEESKRKIIATSPATYETSKQKREQYKFVNVFDQDVTDKNAIIDTYLEQTEQVLISEQRMSELFASAKDLSKLSQSEKAVARNFRSFAQESELEPSIMLVDYSIKAGRSEAEVDACYAS